MNDAALDGDRVVKLNGRFQSEQALRITAKEVVLEPIINVLIVYMSPGNHIRLISLLPQRLKRRHPTNQIPLLPRRQIIQRNPIRPHPPHQPHNIQITLKILRPLLHKRPKKCKLLIPRRTAAPTQSKPEVLQVDEFGKG